MINQQWRQRRRVHSRLALRHTSAAATQGRPRPLHHSQTPAQVPPLASPLLPLRSKSALRDRPCWPTTIPPQLSLLVPLSVSHVTPRGAAPSGDPDVPPPVHSGQDKHLSVSGQTPAWNSRWRMWWCHQFQWQKCLGVVENTRQFQTGQKVGFFFQLQ